MSLTALAASLIVAWAETAHEEPSKLLSWGVGIGILVLFTLIMGALVSFGGGREHS